MSGHSKWSTIKRKKGAIDAKRGKVFTKIIKEISIAARDGGGNIEDNPRLRTIIDKAKAANMPNDNIERAIKRGTGDLEGITYEEVVYEGYGPAGVAMYVEVVTDNKNRTVAEIRHVFSRNGGNLGETNCVGWMFDKLGIITVSKDSTTEDQLMELALEAGASDVRVADDQFEIITAPADLHAVVDSLKASGVITTSAELNMEPQTTVKLDETSAEKMLKLMNALEDHDDVQNVYANFDIDDALMEKLAI